MITSIPRSMWWIVVAISQKRLQLSPEASEEDDARFRSVFDVIRMPKLKAVLLDKIIWMAEVPKGFVPQILEGTAGIQTCIEDARSCLSLLTAPLVTKLTRHLQCLETLNGSLRKSFLQSEN